LAITREVPLSIGSPVHHLPAAPERTQHALSLYIALGAVLQTAHGPAAPEVEHAYTQAYALCQQVGEAPQLVQILFGLWRLYLMRPQLHMVRASGETLLRLAHQAHDPTLAVLAHYNLGVTWFFLGALPAARQSLAEESARSTPDQPHALVFRMGGDLGLGCHVYTAMTLWLLGYPEQARARLDEALTVAHALAHPFSLAWARCAAAVIAQWCREVPAVQAQAEAAVASATVRGLPLGGWGQHWAARGTSIRGWALAL
jgi:hypothetical protein